MIMMLLLMMMINKKKAEGGDCGDCQTQGEAYHDVAMTGAMRNGITEDLGLGDA